MSNLHLFKMYEKESFFYFLQTKHSGNPFSKFSQHLRILKDPNLEVFSTPFYLSFPFKIMWNRLLLSQICHIIHFQFYEIFGFVQDLVSYGQCTISQRKKISSR